MQYLRTNSFTLLTWVYTYTVDIIFTCLRLCFRSKIQVVGFAQQVSHRCPELLQMSPIVQQRRCNDLTILFYDPVIVVRILIALMFNECGNKAISFIIIFFSNE